MLRTSYALNLRSRFSRIAKPLVLPLLFAALGVVAGCDNGNGQAERRYCDSSGCYGCVGDKCYPVPGDPAKPDPGPGKPGTPGTCDTDAACGAGNLCNLGRCEPSCSTDANCAGGESCISGRCRPMGAPQCGIAGALCTADAQCGANSKCVNRACASDCTANACALGQVCSNGSCIEDPAPMSSQCVFDVDCAGGKGGFRCVNAYCLPTCKTSDQCTGGAACVSGICRGNRMSG